MAVRAIRRGRHRADQEDEEGHRHHRGRPAQGRGGQSQKVTDNDGQGNRQDLRRQGKGDHGGLTVDWHAAARGLPPDAWPRRNCARLGVQPQVSETSRSRAGARRHGRHAPRCVRARTPAKSSVGRLRFPRPRYPGNRRNPYTTRARAGSRRSWRSAAFWIETKRRDRRWQMSAAAGR